MSHMARVREMIAQQTGDHPILRYKDRGKDEQRALAQRLGIRVPHLYAGPAPLDSIPEPDAPSVVLKPTDGCVGRVVLPLERYPRGWRSLWDGGMRDWTGWLEWARKAQRKTLSGGCPSTGDWMVEELVGGSGIPYDWKVYVIGGKARWIRQHHKYGRRTRDSYVKAWTPEWIHPGPVMINNKPQKDLPGPRHGPAILAAAERIARELPTPYVRIDMYEDDDGPVFGEITPHPAGGNQTYTPEWDERLGRAWDEVEVPA